MEFMQPLQVIWDYLCLNEPLEKADCIVGFGNFNTDIARRAAELYLKGYAPKVLFTGGLGAHDGAQKIGATVVPMSTGNSKKLTTMMVDFGATAIACTPSYLLHLSEVIRDEGLLDKIKLKSAICGAEPWTEKMRHEIENRLNIMKFSPKNMIEKK